MMVDLQTRKPADELSMPDRPVEPGGVEVGGVEVGLEQALREAALGLPVVSRASDHRTEPTKWEPKQLRPRHREIMRRIVEGASYVDIAEALGISPQSITLVASSAIFQEELAAMELDANRNVIQYAEDLSYEAMDKLKVLMRRARSEALQASCAEKVLGIAGYSKIEKKQIAVVSGEDVIRELNRRRRADAEFSGSDPRGGDSSEAISITEASTEA